MVDEIKNDLTSLKVSVEILSQKLDEIIRIYKQQEIENITLKQLVIKSDRDLNDINPPFSLNSNYDIQ